MALESTFDGSYYEVEATLTCSRSEWTVKFLSDNGDQPIFVRYFYFYIEIKKATTFRTFMCRSIVSDFLFFKDGDWSGLTGNRRYRREHNRVRDGGTLRNPIIGDILATHHADPQVCIEKCLVLPDV